MLIALEEFGKTNKRKLLLELLKDYEMLMKLSVNGTFFRGR